MALYSVKVCATTSLRVKEENARQLQLPCRIIGGECDCLVGYISKYGGKNKVDGERVNNCRGDLEDCCIGCGLNLRNRGLINSQYRCESNSTGSYLFG